MANLSQKLATDNINGFMIKIVSTATDGELPRRRGRPKDEESPASSDQILLLALRAFASVGYDGTSVRELNQQLGVSHNLINRRFGTKDQLWHATVDRWISEVVAELSDALPDEDDPLEALRALIVRFIEVNARRPELAQLINIESSIDGPRLRYLFERYIDPWLAVANRLTDELVAAGRMRALPTGTLFFLVAYGATGISAHRPLATMLGIVDPLDPDVIHAHAVAVSELVLTPEAKARDARALAEPSGGSRYLTIN
jgi:TetR/AcrR family transcriptional regulator